MVWRRAAGESRWPRHVLCTSQQHRRFSCARPPMRSSASGQGQLPKWRTGTCYWHHQSPPMLLLSPNVTTTPAVARMVCASRAQSTACRRSIVLVVCLPGAVITGSQGECRPGLRSLGLVPGSCLPVSEVGSVPCVSRPARRSPWGCASANQAAYGHQIATWSCIPWMVAVGSSVAWPTDTEMANGAISVPIRTALALSATPPTYAAPACQLGELAHAHSPIPGIQCPLGSVLVSGLFATYL